MSYVDAAHADRRPSCARRHREFGITHAMTTLQNHRYRP
jgi:hypothetical protein